MEEYPQMANTQKQPQIDEELTSHINATRKVLEQELHRKREGGSTYFAIGVIKNLLAKMAFSHQFTPEQNAHLQRIVATWQQILDA
jgi:hypothetical protein